LPPFVFCRRDAAITPFCYAELTVIIYAMPPRITPRHYDADAIVFIYAIYADAAAISF